MGEKDRRDYRYWLRRGVPAILIPGIIFSSIYGVKSLQGMENYESDENIFPKSGYLEEVEDGDTFRLQSGQTVRLIGMNAPERGKPGQRESKEELEKLLTGRKLWLEYDRYQDDKYGRILGWIWINCETDIPEFLPANYMRVYGKMSQNYLTSNPKGCLQGTLVNSDLVKRNLARPVQYEGRGRLKYQLR